MNINGLGLCYHLDFFRIRNGKGIQTIFEIVIWGSYWTVRVWKMRYFLTRRLKVICNVIKVVNCFLHLVFVSANGKLLKRLLVRSPTSNFFDLVKKNSFVIMLPVSKTMSIWFLPSFQYFKGIDLKKVDCVVIFIFTPYLFCAFVWMYFI